LLKKVKAEELKWQPTLTPCDPEPTGVTPTGTDTGGTETGTRSVCPGTETEGRKPGRDQFAQAPEKRIALNTNRVPVSVMRSGLLSILIASRFPSLYVVDHILL
jgi:hypothetical protein